MNKRVLQRFKNEENVRLRSIAGRPPKVVTPKLVSKIKKRYIKKPGSLKRQLFKDEKRPKPSAVRREKLCLTIITSNHV